jgi:hypothetical protein
MTLCTVSQAIARFFVRLLSDNMVGKESTSLAQCPRCGNAFAADAADLMISMGIVAFAECPSCHHEFLPLSSDDIGEPASKHHERPFHPEAPEDYWRYDT